jgi:Tfp pilus assembly protein PilN
MMPSLDIDFSRARPAPARTGLVLLGAGLLLLGASAYAFWQVSSAHAAARSAYAQATYRPPVKKHRVTPPSPALQQAEKQNQAIRDELTVPWQSLLALVENSPVRQVALIGIDQEPGQRQLHITAEAKDTAAMLDYLHYLQQSSLLREALLNEHLVETRTPGTPVRFQITAIWRTP